MAFKTYDGPGPTQYVTCVVNLIVAVLIAEIRYCKGFS